MPNESQNRRTLWWPGEDMCVQKAVEEETAYLHHAANASLDFMVMTAP